MFDLITTKRLRRFTHFLNAWLTSSLDADPFLFSHDIVFSLMLSLQSVIAKQGLQTDNLRASISKLVLMIFKEQHMANLLLVDAEVRKK